MEGCVVWCLFLPKNHINAPVKEISAISACMIMNCGVNIDTDGERLSTGSASTPGADGEGGRTASSSASSEIVVDVVEVVEEDDPELDEPKLGAAAGGGIAADTAIELMARIISSNANLILFLDISDI